MKVRYQIWIISNEEKPHFKLDKWVVQRFAREYIRGYEMDIYLNEEDYKKFMEWKDDEQTKNSKKMKKMRKNMEEAREIKKRSKKDRKSKE